MSISSPFIHRPIGTTLLTVFIALAGGVAFYVLPVSPLPQVTQYCCWPHPRSTGSPHPMSSPMLAA